MADIPNPWINHSSATAPTADGSGAAQGKPPCAAPVSITEPSMTMEAPDEAPAITENPCDRRDFDEAGIPTSDWDPDGIDNIGEIFFHATKLIADDYRDWALTQADDELYEALKREVEALDEPLPLFIRQDGQLKRRA